jgi:RsiW-degrading membrane proteinase PrsW (M82 family)
LIVASAIPIAIAIAVPLAFLYAVRRYDLYASSDPLAVVACLVWGLLAFCLVRPIGAHIQPIVGFSLGVVLVAPLVEEVVKSVAVAYRSRLPSFTYFVDGAIYGFAAGTAFAILETVDKMSASQAPLALSVNRVFTTSLMHGTATALVGVALGLARFGRGATRSTALALGLVCAAALHMSFNRLTLAASDPRILGLLWLIGLGGVLLVLAFIRWGLVEERAWLRESLGPAVGVTERESAVVQSLSDLDTLLAPIEQRFGSARRQQVEAFLRLQVRMGLKCGLQQRTSDARLREQLDAEVASLRRQMEDLRRQVGVYCMMYVRSVLPRNDESLWRRLEPALAVEPGTGSGMWRGLGDQVVGPAPASAGLFGPQHQSGMTRERGS